MAACATYDPGIIYIQAAFVLQKASVLSKFFDMKEGTEPILPLPKQKVTKRDISCVDRDHIRGWEVAGPLFEAGVNAINISRLPKYKGNEHLSSSHRISLVVQGQMQFQVDSRTITARTGDLVYTPPGIKIQRSGMGPIVWLFIQLDDIPMWVPLKNDGPYVRKYESADLMYILVRRVIGALRSPDVYSIQTARESSEVLITLMKREFKQSGNAWPSKRMDYLVKILDRIHARPGLEWDRTTIAQELNVSERTLIREFKRVFNVPPSKMVSNIRMDIAARLLINTDRTLADIASFVGYQSPFSFSRLFKKYIGVSPEHYRNMPAAERQQPTLNN